MFYTDFNKFIQERTSKLNTENRETKSYVHGIFRQYISSNGDLSKDIIIIKYSEAQKDHSFQKHQQLADWLFFGLSTFPEHFNNCSQEYYETIGKMSYYKCYKILHRKWPCFEELADRFEEFVDNIKR
jgi:hypothetical protein